jgi:hypothetical protein
MRCLRVFSIAVLLVLLGGSGYSCGPSLAPEATMFMLFQRDVVADNALTPFAYSQPFLYSTATDDETDMMKNCREWEAFTGGKVPARDVYMVQYGLTTAQYFYGRSTGKWDGAADNKFIQWLAGNKAAAKYMDFARWVEHTSDNESEDPWSNSSYGDGLSQLQYDSLITVATNGYKSTTGFLQERYAFQAVKLLFYKGWPQADTLKRDRHLDDSLIAVYNKYLKGKPSITADWALVYYAQVQPGEQQTLKYLLQAFERTDDKKLFVYRYLSRKQVDILARTATDNAPRATACAIKGFKTPGPALAQLRNVYSCDKNSRYLPMLIAREVNKLEDWIWSPEMKGFTSAIRAGYDKGYDDATGYNVSTPAKDKYLQKNRAKDEAYLATVRSFLEEIATDGGNNADFARLAIVHLYHMQRNYAAAAGYMDKIHAVKNTAWARQLDIEKILSLIYSADITSDDTKQKINDVMQHLEQLGGGNVIASAGDYDIQADSEPLHALYLLLSREYRKKGDIVTAGLLMQQGGQIVDEYMGNNPGCRNIDTLTEYEGNGEYYYRIAYFEKFGSPADIDALLAFKHKKHFSAFEQRLVPCRWPSDDVYLDVKGTLLLRQERYKEALATFSKIRPDFWEHTYDYIHYLRKNSVTSVGTLLPFDNGSGRRYVRESKKDIVEEIVAVQDSLAKATADSTRAVLSFWLGNCYYNISFAGKDWMVFNYGKSTDEHAWKHDFVYYSFNTSSRQQYDNYYLCKAAVAMYTQARKYAVRNPELNAQCLLMLALCDNQVHHYNATKYEDYEHRYISPYIGMLDRLYGKRDMFDRTTDCPDVYDYLKRRGRM